MPKFIQLSEFSTGGKLKLCVNIDTIFSIHQPTGGEMTVVKSMTTFEQVQETPEQIMVMIAAAEVS